MDMKMWGKNIDFNNFKSDIIYDMIEESWLKFHDARDGKGELSKPKGFSHKKWAQ